jgi:hypothetical protein
LLHWKFDLVMQIFPLLLQFSLLLFAVALSIYLWTVHHARGGIVLGLTSLGFIFYSLMVISALKSPDSPFQTSLTTVLREVMKFTPPEPLRRLSSATRVFLHTVFYPLCRLSAQAWSSSSDFIKTHSPGFRIWKSSESSAEEVNDAMFDPIPAPSKEVAAIIWTLETSTDPLVVQAAAAVVPNLQWPVNMDLRPSVRRLADIFNGCLTDHRISDTLMDRAMTCIRAFGLLQMVSERQDVWSDLWTFDTGNQRWSESSMVRYFDLLKANKAEGHSPAITQWTLRFISAQHPFRAHQDLNLVLEHFEPEKNSLGNLSVFADFLFCLNSFFAPPLARDLSLMDKR